MISFSNFSFGFWFVSSSFDLNGSTFDDLNYKL